MNQKAETLENAFAFFVENMNKLKTLVNYRTYLAYKVASGFEILI